MKATTALGALAAVAFFGAWTGEASATTPASVFTHVDKVVFDNPADPTTIEIHGPLMLHSQGATGQYSGWTDPARGYVYYSCPAGQKAVCQMEWAEIQKNVGTSMDLCIGITVGASTQVGLLVAPVLVFLGMILGRDMDLIFTPLEVMAIVKKIYVDVPEYLHPAAASSVCEAPTSSP